jgi:hypothetical protein
LARQEVVRFSKPVAFVLVDEECDQQALESGGEATGTNSFGNPANIGPGNPVRIDPRGRRRWRATIWVAQTPALPAANGRPWIELRHVLEVDGRRLSPPDGGAPALFARPDWSPEEAFRLSRDNGHFNIGPAGRLAATPWLPLLILHPVNERRFSFDKTGEEVVRKTGTWKVSFRERTAPTLFMTGENGCGATGSFWIQPTTGRLLRAVLQCVDLGRPDVVSAVNVDYRHDEELGLDVPLEMSEHPESDSAKEWLGRRGKLWVEGKCRYSRLRRGALGSDGGAP